MVRRKENRSVWVLAFIFAGLVVVTGVSKLRGGKEIVEWRGDFEKARAEAAEKHQPVFLYFTAEWCGPCQEMRRTTWADKNVAQELGGKYVPVRLDLDREKELAGKYHVEAIPWFAVLDEEGRVVKMTDGYMESGEFLEWLRGEGNGMVVPPVGVFGGR
ncbi:MAG TPA: thioredoxin family protein [Tepidisphaeraceae bacterium]|jgi:thiol:disulfide interchange protein|nr:thioredoxin family protein [Tepidisphaeraceae bacterium]